MAPATHGAPSHSCGQRVWLQGPVFFRTFGSARARGAGYGLFPGRTSRKACWDLSGNQTHPKGQWMLSGQREDVMDHKDTGAILA